jgi:hypothetical protein
MSFLKELEVKVHALLKKYQEAQDQIKSLQESQEALKATCETLETALLQESSHVGKLLEEKESIRLSVDELLINIKTLEETEK